MEDLKKVFICESCGKEHDGTYGSGRFCSLSCKNRRYNSKYKLLHPYEYLKKDFICQCNVCGNKYVVNTSQKNFDSNNYRKTCSSKCAHSRVRTDEIKLKISKSVHNTNKTIKICKYCHCEYYMRDEQFPSATKIFCSKDCSLSYLKENHGYLSAEAKSRLSEFARKNIAKMKDEKRSKNEILFCLLCELYFNNVEHNVPIFNGWDADVIIHDIKYAILWNGIWHYKKVAKKHSVELVKSRDKIKIKEIKNKNYIPYIIKDMGKYNEAFVKELFDIFLTYLLTNKNIL